MIQKINIITAQGAKTYEVGHELNGEKIAKIVKGALHFTGDPYDHYIGYSDKGEMLFSVNCLCPCDIEYLIK